MRLFLALLIFTVAMIYTLGRAIDSAADAARTRGVRAPLSELVR
jgi:hypothetical protein